MNIKPVYLYSDHPSKSLSIAKIIEGLDKLNIHCESKGNFFEYLNLNKDEQLELYKKISQTRVDDIEREKYRLDTVSENHTFDNKVLYDGFLFTKVVNKYFMSNLDRPQNNIYIIFTNRLLCTFENKRYHARVILMGYPTFISTSGLVEAPAKPREYYFLKAQYIAAGKNTGELDEYFKGKYVGYDDPKTTDILLSYTLQAIFYELTGQAFCSSKKCCLFNSHWQKDVLEIQYRAKLCQQHQKLLDNLS
jgi:hypothetical protein